MSMRLTVWLMPLAVLTLVVLSMVVFYVPEGQRAIITRFGHILTGQQEQSLVYTPGLHFKLPVVDKVSMILTKSRDYNVPNSKRILTSEQKYMMVDYYVVWQVADVPLYFKRTANNDAIANQLIAQKVENSLREIFGQLTLKQVISDERLNTMNFIQNEVNSKTVDLGLNIIDVRIIKIDLPEKVTENVFQRMSSDREKVATRYRSEGKSEAMKIRAQADADVVVILADASAEAAKIRAQGQLQAAQLYNDAFKKHPAFFEKLMAYDAYKAVFQSQDFFVLDANSMRFFDYMTSKYEH